MAEQNKSAHALDLSGIQDDDLPYLGAPPVVAEIMAELGEGYIDDIEAKSNGSIDDEGFVNRALARCEKAAKILLGQDDSYAPRRYWNEPGFIDAWVAKAAGIEERDPVQRLVNVLAVYLGDVQAAVQELSDGGSLPVYETKIAGQTEYFTALFLGLNPEAND